MTTIQTLATSNGEPGFIDINNHMKSEPFQSQRLDDKTLKKGKKFLQFERKFLLFISCVEGG